MDAGDKTLNGILNSISAENDLVGYNTYRNRKGRIIVKISYEEPEESEPSESSEVCDQQEESHDGFDKSRISFRKMSETQCKRQYYRTRNYPPKNQKLAKDIIEAPRKSEEIIHSTPVPFVLDTSQCIPEECLPESPVTHAVSDHDQSCEESFHDVCDSLVIPESPEKIGSVSHLDPQVPDPVEIKMKPKISRPKFKSRVYDSDKFDSVHDALKEPNCDKKNCSFGPDPDNVDPSVVWTKDDKREDQEWIIKKCPHCNLQVCMLCMKYKGRHKKYFTDPPPWD